MTEEENQKEEPTEAKRLQKEFISKVTTWKKENEKWNKEKAFTDAISDLGKTTVITYRSNVPKFLSFINQTPDQVIAQRAEDITSTDPEMARRYENLMGEYKKHLISLHYQAGSIKSMLSCASGFFTNNGYKLNLSSTFFKPKESELVKATVQKFIEPPTREEVKEIFELADLDTKIQILLGFQAGMNPVDVVKTSWEQIGVEDWDEEDREFIPVKRDRSKTDVSFFWFVTPDIAFHLKQKWVKMGKPTSGYVFAKRVDKKREDGSTYREYDGSDHLSRKKLNPEFNRYAEMALSSKRGKQLTFTDLRDGYTNLLLHHLKDSAAQEIKDLLMGHVRESARSDYKVSPLTLKEYYIELYPHITLNGWVEKVKAEGFDELEARYETLQKTVTEYMIKSRSFEDIIERQDKKIKQQDKTIMDLTAQLEEFQSQTKKSIEALEKRIPRHYPIVERGNKE